MSRWEALVLGGLIVVLIASIVLLCVYGPSSTSVPTTCSVGPLVALGGPTALGAPPADIRSERSLPPSVCFDAPSNPPPTFAPEEPAPTVVHTVALTETATALSWDDSTRLLTLGLPYADHGYGRLQTYQIHPDLATSDEADVVFRPVRSVSFAWGGTPQQHAGYCVREAFVLAPHATLNPSNPDSRGQLYHVRPDQAGVHRLNLGTNDAGALSDQGDMFRRFQHYLVVARRQGRVDVWDVTRPDQPRLEASLLAPEAEAAPDFGHHLCWQEAAQRLWVSSPAVGKLYGFVGQGTPRRWTWQATGQLGAVPGAGDITFWDDRNLWVVSCPGVRTTYLVDPDTWQPTETLSEASHHKVSQRQLVTWDQQRLRLYGRNTALVCAEAIQAAEGVDAHNWVLLTAASTLVWARW